MSKVQCDIDERDERDRDELPTGNGGVPVNDGDYRLVRAIELVRVINGPIYGTGPNDEILEARNGALVSVGVGKTVPAYDQGRQLTLPPNLLVSMLINRVVEVAQYSK